MYVYSTEWYYQHFCYSVCLLRVGMVLIQGVQLLRGPTRPVHRSKLYVLRDRPPRESSVSAPESELTRLPKEVKAST
jgi:hypothetical protein